MPLPPVRPLVLDRLNFIMKTWIAIFSAALAALLLAGLVLLTLINRARVWEARAAEYTHRLVRNVEMSKEWRLELRDLDGLRKHWEYAETMIEPPQNHLRRAPLWSDSQPLANAIANTLAEQAAAKDWK